MVGVVVSYLLDTMIIVVLEERVLHASLQEHNHHDTTNHAVSHNAEAITDTTPSNSTTGIPINPPFVFITCRGSVDSSILRLTRGVMGHSPSSHIYLPSAKGGDIEAGHWIICFKGCISSMVAFSTGETPPHL